MAGDEAEHSETAAEPGIAPGALHETQNETPVNGAETKSHGELEEAGAQPAETEPSVIASPETRAQSEAQIPVDEEAPETGDAPAPVWQAPGGGAEQLKPRSRFPALAATAIAGGILGLGGSFALRHFENSPTAGVASDDRIAALTTRLEAIEGKGDAASGTALAALEARVAAAESTANKAAETAASAQADLQKDSASRPAVQEPAAGSTLAEAPDLGPLNERIGALEQKLASLEQSHSSLAEKQASLESALAAPKGELRARQQDRETPAAKQSSRAQAIAIVAQGLLHKLESGGQFPDEIAALENLGVPADTLAPLRAASAQAIPSERQLTAQFAALAPAIIAADPANQPSPDEGFLDRVTRHAKGLVHIRRVGEAETMDTEGLVERIEKALAEHDLDAAYKAWKELPSAATTKSASWGEAAKARIDALNAARSIEADAVAALGKPKS